MGDAFLIILILIAAAAPVVGIAAGRYFTPQERDDVIAQIRAEARDLETRIIDTLANEKTLASKKELQELRLRIREYQSTAESQKLSRVELEKKLSASLSDVITRESALQEMKTQQQNDEERLRAVLDSYKDVSTESVSLERTLADSLRTIDKMTTEVSMSEDQKAVFDSLTAALTNASSQLRDVIMEHQNVYERLTAIRAQYTDLEAEYIKLVDMQLEG